MGRKPRRMRARKRMTTLLRRTTDLLRSLSTTFHWKNILIWIKVFARKTDVVVAASRRRQCRNCTAVVANFPFTGCVKRVSLDAYRSENRGGKGKIGLIISSDDLITNVGCTRRRGRFLRWRQWKRLSVNFL